SDTGKVMGVLNWCTLPQRREQHILNFMYKVIRNQVPSYVSSIFEEFKNPATRRTSNTEVYQIPIRSTAQFIKSPIPNAISLWNKLPKPLLEYALKFSLPSFKKESNKHFLPKRIISSTSLINLTRSQEITLNRARVDLFLKARLFAHQFTFIDSAHCSCGKPETLKHLFFKCPLCQINRHALMEEVNNNFYNKISQLTNMDDKLNFLLYGDEALSLAELSKLLIIVSNFLHDNKT
ncbi:unnamed protein product, partial [Owenia fusiformis]